MIRTLLAGHLAMVLTLFMATPTLAQSTDDAAIRAVQAEQERAWNAHDAHAYAQLFAEDADIITARGWHWKGRTEAEGKLGQAFAYVFAQSRLHIDEISIRPLPDDLALAYVSWSMTGTKNPDGSLADAPLRGIQTQLLGKKDGRWWIISSQDTNAQPERPFPAGPSGTATAPAPVAAPVPAENRKCFLGTRDSCFIYKKTE